ncbi:MAG: biotin--[acetyl-CoA-carboxylase] ligase [Bradyrhizobiaceae bacterium]|nr:biotin--[acetyl-CoA-carboxylase] ligase [Bradyrhizobiaceae bacterium]
MGYPTPIEFHLPTVSSTNDYAKELLVTYPYVFVSAMHQTAGRGRKGRSWSGDYGLNAYCSLGIRHTVQLSYEDLSSYMARGALAAIDALRSITDRIQFRLKYPNDVHALTPDGWKKICGVLVEHEFQGDRCMTSVIGIGVNVQQERFPETISTIGTSLYQLGVHANVLVVLECLKSNITVQRMRPWHEVYEEWIRELDLQHKQLSIAGEEGIWKVLEVLPDGRLVATNERTTKERIITDGDTIRYLD